MLSENGEPFVLEVNTIPGMTEASLLPEAAASPESVIRNFVCASSNFPAFAKATAGRHGPERSAPNNEATAATPRA